MTITERLVDEYWHLRLLLARLGWWVRALWHDVDWWLRPPVMALAGGFYHPWRWSRASRTYRSLLRLARLMHPGDTSMPVMLFEDTWPMFEAAMRADWRI